MTSIASRLLGLWTILIVLGTLAPFDFGATGAVHEHSFKVFQYGAYERDPFDFVFNVLLFVPFGVLLNREAERRRSTLASTALVAAAFGFLLSFIVEYFQEFLPSRDSSLIDVVANTLGAVAGVGVGRLVTAPIL